MCLKYVLRRLYFEALFCLKLLCFIFSINLGTFNGNKQVLNRKNKSAISSNYCCCCTHNTCFKHKTCIILTCQVFSQLAIYFKHTKLRNETKLPYFEWNNLSDDKALKIGDI